MLYIMYKRSNLPYSKVVLLNLNVTILIYFEGQLLNLGYDFEIIKQAVQNVELVVQSDFFLL